MRRALKFSLAVALPILVWLALVTRRRAAFPKDTTPEGAYARIVLAITEGHPRDCFPYLETQAQWASFSIRDYRQKAATRIEQAYPEPEKSMALAAYQRESTAPDGPDVWVLLAESRGFIARLRNDLSGASHIEEGDERATIETAHGTRYTFRRRENGIWGLTMFTAELMAEAEKAARDFEMIGRAARDYERARDPASPRATGSPDAAQPFSETAPNGVRDPSMPAR
jgi:hypothetical protein